MNCGPFDFVSDVTRFSLLSWKNKLTSYAGPGHPPLGVGAVALA